MSSNSFAYWLFHAITFERKVFSKIHESISKKSQEKPESTVVCWFQRTLKQLEREQTDTQTHRTTTVTLASEVQEEEDSAVVHRGHLPERLLFTAGCSRNESRDQNCNCACANLRILPIIPVLHSYLSIIPGFMPAQAYLVVTDTNTPTKFQVLILLCV